ncbi:helix-turn-helix domain-containing protein [Neptuniibacter marinus]|uniref:helix-turn-helix domain-containing protein n=1 Tax=Neptuniibacter marinus TaxID=1806670 RepID=UPI003B5B8CEC
MKPSTYSKQYQELRLWLKAKREERGLSIRAVAEILQRHHSVIGKLEQDRRRIDIIELVAYCHAIGADPHEAIDVLEQSFSTKVLKSEQAANSTPNDNSQS